MVSAQDESAPSRWSSDGNEQRGGPSSIEEIALSGSAPTSSSADEMAERK